MSRNIRRAAVVGVGLLTALIGPGGRPAGGAPIPKEKPEREVRLDAVHTTSHQKGMSRLNRVTDDEAHMNDVSAVQEVIGLSSVSNIFLVRGDDVKAAVRDTLDRLRARVDKEAPGEKDRRLKSKQSWLVVYLTYGSSIPVRAHLESVAVFADRVQVRYSQPELVGEYFVTMDLLYYAYWIPLGELKATQTTFQLIDHKSGDVVLMRREAIKPPK